MLTVAPNLFPRHNGRVDATQWPGCVACQTSHLLGLSSNAPPPLLLSPFFSLVNTKRARKLTKQHTRMAHILRAPILALHGLHQGHTFPQTSIPACYWRCALPLHRRQWHHIYTSPLSTQVRQLTEECHRPRTQGKTPPPMLFTTHLNPYQPTPHRHVPKHAAKAHLVALPQAPIHALPFPTLLPPTFSQLYMSSDTLILQDTEAWHKATTFKSTAALPPLWMSVANEFRALLALSPLLFMDLRRPHAHMLLASDASESGAGACRASAPAYPIPHVAEVEWQILFSFPWKFKEHIIPLEARAMLYALRRLLFTHQGDNCRLLLYSDNLPICCAANKGRSSSVKLSRILRSVSAALLTASSSLSVVWIPTVDNPADKPSRLFYLCFVQVHPSPIIWRITQGLRPATVRTYALSIRRFLAFTAQNSPFLTLDGHLLQYAASLPDSSRTQPFSRLMAALRHFFPDFQLPESRRLQSQLLRTHQSISPSLMLYETVTLVAYQLISDSFITTTLGLLLQFDTYLRPGELCAIKKGDLYFPSTTLLPHSISLPILALPAAKTGSSQSVTIRDHRLYPPLKKLIDAATSSSSLLFPSYPIYLARFSSALGKLNLLTAGYTPHSVRHGGATTDLIRNGEQAIPGILYRGRWESTAGRRYLQMGPAAILQAQHPPPPADLVLTANRRLFQHFTTSSLLCGH